MTAAEMAAYEAGRRHALEEVLRAALRVRGDRRTGRRVEEITDEHEDGSYATGQAMVSFIRVLMKRKKARTG